MFPAISCYLVDQGKFIRPSNENNISHLPTPPPAALMGAGHKVMMAFQLQCCHWWDSCELFASRYTGSEREKGHEPLLVHSYILLL